ncbi:hypothetical protein EW145_g96 [Phellinidium pouzarii]|uniref:FH2 domain-containing protein n=1 Tax=Phellinidium pouzarii TaxID=167371 RepID=A0A4S4LLF2_9AGAM|nr:hypothetical protein EW145_g96 [Phellinidium pouzarii]
MADGLLIVPVLSPSGTVYFASVPQEATTLNVITTLLKSRDVRDDILGDLSDDGWDLQKVRKEATGRVWEEEELKHIGADLLPTSCPIAPLLVSKAQSPALERHFSLFPLTSHLHSPLIRIVSRHPLLSVKFSFLRVPEIHDGFEWTIYLTRSMAVKDVINDVCEQLGLVRSLPVLDGGTIEYAIEENWVDKADSHTRRLNTDLTISSVLESLPNNSYETSASRTFTFCVPDEWYRRPDSHVVSMAPSESTLRRLEELENEEGEGTAKQVKPPSSPSSPLARRSGSPDSSGTFSSRRFSSIFDGWLGSSSTSSPIQEDESQRKRPVVSEPLSIDRRTSASSDSEHESSSDDEDFEKMIDDLGLKGEKREAMRKLTPDRKRYLLRQNRQMRSTNVKDTPQALAQSATLGPARTLSLFPVLAPSLTGDGGIMRRFSITSWGSPAATHSPELSSGSPASPQTSPSSRQNPQSTGSLWSSWWASSESDAYASSPSRMKSSSTRDTAQSASFYVEGLRTRRATDIKLVKHLISLRVHLSTAKLSWVEQFLHECKGMDSLASLLASLVGKGGKRKKLVDVEESVLYEVVKCLRVLLNTEPGFNQFLASSTLITYVTYALHTETLKLRSLTCELLAAVCLLSVTHGHRLVLAAFSDYRVAYEEAFRFEELVDALKLPDGDDEEGSGLNEEGAWEARTAAMTLVNAMTACPESLEERIQLREEFSRRGLNEIIVTLRYIRPPDSIITQIDVYTEEKFEDEEDLRERTRTLVKDVKGGSEFELACAMLYDLSAREEVLRPSTIELLRRLGTLLGRETTLKFKADYLTVLSVLLEQGVSYDELVDWGQLLQQFVSCIGPIIGQQLNIRSSFDTIKADADSGEIEVLRKQVECSGKEREDLQSKLIEQRAEIETLKLLHHSFPSTVGPSRSGKEGIQGLVQRLILKEKQVVQLQAEVDRLKLDSPSETRVLEERLKHERDRVKWNALMEEIADLKTKNREVEATLQRRDKEVLYLKRAMESVYSRLHESDSHGPATKKTQIRDFDAEQVAARAVEALSAKDEEIANLREDVVKLREELKTKPQYITEVDFKKGVSPPPPPPLVSSRLGAIKNGSFSPSSPPPSPPALEHTISPIHVHTSPLPPPPPPPPPPPSFNASLLAASSPSPPPAMTSFPPLPPPPPPPTPPGSMGHQLSSTTNLALPGKRLKPFFWTKVSNTAVGPTVGPTVWDDLSNAESAISLDLKELEDTFSLEAKPSKVSVPGQNSTRRGTVSTMLDITRANNILIMLSRIKLSLPDIKRALLTIDDSLLSVDDLKAIGKQIPSAEEMKRINEFGDAKQLAKADQYFKEASGLIADIPRLADRINCMLYRRKLELDIEETRPELDILRHVTKELKLSTRFKQVLKAILTIGNVLNGSSFRGNAHGFQLGALLKMKEAKTAKSTPECPTLLHYIARVLLKSDAELINFLDDLPHLEAAARVSMQTISTAVAILSSGLAQVMEPFVIQVTASVQALENMCKTVEADLNSVMAYFGENVDSPEGPKPEDFFSLVVSFSSSLRKAALEMHEVQTRANPTDTSTPKNSKSTLPMPSVAEQTTAFKKLVTPTSSAAPAISSRGPLVPPPPPPDHSSMDSRHRSVGRGELDETIKSMRRGMDLDDYCL